MYADGRLKTNKYEDREGDTRYYTNVVAQVVQFLSDSRAEDALGQKYGIEEEEDLEPSELPGF